MREEVERARRYALGFSLVLLEVDEPAATATTGDTPSTTGARGALSRLLRDAFRTPDLVARYGEDGYALLLPETGAAQALGAVRRLRVRLADEPSNGSTPSVAAGIAGFPHPAATEAGDVLALASAALMRARAQAGERIGVAE
jgi:diguanylate cyclase (GGDEF)-like protein